MYRTENMQSIQKAGPFDCIRFIKKAMLKRIRECKNVYRAGRN